MRKPKTGRMASTR
uniref:Uncharacterized protein n=1 Tax=Rhizophora mucronata TaxID=61149 RepID=A0A2P2NPS2_RHIMU